VTTRGDYEVTFHLKRPQTSFLALLASGWSPVYPCHVSPRDMRQHPIGTGPFKFVEFKPNQSIAVTRNPEVDKLINQQSIETDQVKRKQLVWEIERKLVEDDARPIIFFPRGAVYRQPQLRGFSLMVNSIYNGQRFEDLWLDK
jgi:ABC-type transport system substrate-binding protein